MSLSPCAWWIFKRKRAFFVVQAQHQLKLRAALCE